MMIACVLVLVSSENIQVAAVNSMRLLLSVVGPFSVMLNVTLK